MDISQYETLPSDAVLVTGEIASAFLSQRCEQDTEFRAAFEQAPGKATGIDGNRVSMVENTDEVFNLAVPAYKYLLATEELGDEHLDDVSGGFGGLGGAGDSSPLGLATGSAVTSPLNGAGHITSTFFQTQNLVSSVFNYAIYGGDPAEQALEPYLYTGVY